MTDVLIVGGGLAGLACAAGLARQGVDFELLEARDRVGGVARTDRFDGFLLDRGFQFLTRGASRGGDPIGRELIDESRLQLRPFGPGALLWHRDRWQAFGSDSAGAPLSAVDLLGRRLVERFATGQPALPAAGIEAVALQGAEPLPAGSLHTHATVESMEQNELRMTDGSCRRGRVVVLAVEASAVERLLEQPADAALEQLVATTCYFAAAAPPTLDDHPLDRLLLAGPESSGPIHHAAVLSGIAPSYAPDGQALIAATVLQGPLPGLEPLDARSGASEDDPQRLWGAVRAQLRQWFGSRVDRWRPLRSYRVAVPLGVSDSRGTGPGAEPLGPDGPIVCTGAGSGAPLPGDSIPGAIRGGLRAAEAALRRLGG